MINKIFDILRVSVVQARTTFKVKTEDSLIGIFWYLLEPIILFLIIINLRSNLKLTVIEMYPLYLAIGLIVFNFFRKTTNLMIDSFISGSSIIKNTIFSNISIVSAKLFNALFSHSFEILLIIVLMIFYKINIFNILYYLIFLCIFSIFVYSVGLMLAIFRIFIADLNNVWSVLMNLTWFVTPIFYVAGTSGYVNVNHVNPLYYFISFARGILIYGRFDFLLISLIMSLVLFGISIFLYYKVKNKLPELI